MNKVYTTTMNNTGGRNGGRSVDPNGPFAVDIAPPKELGGKDSTATNPEQLFAAGYSACFNSALASVLRKDRINKPAQVSATVHLLKDPDEGYRIAVDITSAVEGFTQAENQKYADLAHQVCPYSKAIRGNVAVTVTGL